jgi:hypothetical protein
MKDNFNFDIKPFGQISNEFLDRQIKDFQSAANFIRQLPYKRNTDKHDPLIVFKDSCGTCSTKHATLRQLAKENSNDKVRLILSIFKMNSLNTPVLAGTLARHDLSFIPEAHNYLRVEDEIMDCTKTGWGKENYINDILFETEIEPLQINDFKVSYHKKYLENWLLQDNLKYTLTEIWEIREQCILDLMR